MDNISYKVLLRTDRSWDGECYDHYPSGPPELSLLRYEIPPRAVVPWHRHFAPCVGMVVSGTLHVESRSGLWRVLEAGDALPEMVETAHRGIAGDEPVVLLVFYAGVKGMPMTIFDSP
ncbi:cupin domain-containing protein [Chromobacterium violaceum]